uniref:Protein CDV3 homolog n=1 Tax=Crassostrea virginica TaxID=6565 RepID=A0A8B8E727_CRAVI|nr:protein CDV3 homolog [Crassostrea virginica]
MMAESSLDDFFAKKDKSKKKSKSKITPGDILSQQEKELGSKKKTKKKNKENESTQSSGSGAESGSRKIEEDEEWVDFEQETEKDYSGLRIQNLQINKDKSDQEDEGNENENDDECDENGERREGAQGPWNASQGQSAQGQQPPPPQQQPAPQAAAAPAPAEESKSDTTPARPGKYVPPSLRGAMSASGSSDSPAATRQVPRKKKAAPNLHSEEDFPTLGGGPTAAELSELSGSSFNKVQFGGKNVEDPNKAQQSLSLGNKFSALQD